MWIVSEVILYTRIYIQRDVSSCGQGIIEWDQKGNIYSPKGIQKMKIMSNYWSKWLAYRVSGIPYSGHLCGCISLLIACTYSWYLYLCVCYLQLIWQPVFKIKKQNPNFLNLLGLSSRNATPWYSYPFTFIIQGLSYAIVIWYLGWQLSGNETNVTCTHRLAGYVVTK